MKMYNEFNKIQFLKEKVEELFNKYIRKRVIINNYNGTTVRGTYQGIEWNKDKEHFYLLMKEEHSGDQLAFECIKLKFDEMTYDGFSLTYNND